MADVAAVLWLNYLKHNPKNPAWADRDRFILSAGHGSMLHYSLLHLAGFEDKTIDELKQFRQWASEQLATRIWSCVRLRRQRDLGTRMCQCRRNGNCRKC